MTYRLIKQRHIVKTDRVKVLITSIDVNHWRVCETEIEHIRW